MRTRWIGVLAVAAVFAGCSGSGDAAGPATSAEAEATIDGVPASRHAEAVREWDAVVAEWDGLADRGDFETFAEWARATGRPVRFEDVLDKYR